MMNKWQRLNVAVLDAIVDDGPLTADEIVARVDYRIDAHFSEPRVRSAIDSLHRGHALIAYFRKGGDELIFVVNTTQPQTLRAVWRGESIDAPGDVGSCIVPGTTSHAQ